MRGFLLATVTLVTIGSFSVPSFAQSATASNIDPGDTHSDIAPRLPVPPVAQDAGAAAFARVALDALREHRTGEAQEALERAETRALDVSDDPAAPRAANAAAMSRSISDAREALGNGDAGRAESILDAALSQPAAPATASAATTTATTTAATPGTTSASAQSSGGVSTMPARPMVSQSGVQGDTFGGKTDAEHTLTGKDDNAETYTTKLPDSAGEDQGVGSDNGG